MYIDDSKERPCYVHMLSEEDFRNRLCDTYGKECLSVKAFDYVRTRMNAQNGYIRRYSGEDYFVHVQAVAEILMDNTKASDVLISVALLHDCIEDLPKGTEQELIERFGEEITEKVRLLSKTDDVDDNDSKLRAYLESILSDHDATLAKIADRMNNNSTYKGASDEEKRLKTKETQKFYVPMAECAIKRYPDDKEFLLLAKSFFEKAIP